MHFKNQSEMFNWIWENREHISEFSGKPLLPQNHIQWVWQFCHVLPKGSYPKYKLNPENILLGLPEEHESQDRHKVFNDKKQELTRAYYKEFYNKKYE